MISRARQLALVSSLAVLALATFPGCGARNSGASRETARVELIYWPAPNTQEIEMADSVVAQWNALHPDVHVLMQPIPASQSTEEVLLAAIAGKTTPDVCSNIWPGALHEYTQSGGLIPLDTFPDFNQIALARIPPELLKTFRSDDGHLYQFPWKTNPVMMFYNLSMLRDAGIDSIPRTYSEYFAAAKKITRDTTGDGQMDVWMGERDVRPIWWQRLFDFFPFYIAASGGGTLFANGEVAFDNDAGRNVLSFFRECYAKEYFPRTFFQGGDPFDLGRKASHIAGPWQLAHLQKFVPNLKYTVVPIPVPDGHTGPVYTSGDFKNIAIFSNTAHPKEAWEFVKFLVTARHDLLLLELCNQIPLRGDLEANPLFAAYFDRQPLMKTFARQAPYTRSMDAVPDLKEIFDAISQEYEASAVFGRKTPAEAIHDAASRAHTIAEWNR